MPQRFVVTRHGQLVAELVPVAGRNVERIRHAIADLRSVNWGLARRAERGTHVRRAGAGRRDLAHSGHRR